MQDIYRPGEANSCRGTGSKRDLILLSAFELFYQKGYHKTKIQDIARHADIGKGTFYEYFQSKERLLGELLLLKITEDQALLEKINASSDPIEKKIRAFYLFEQKNLKEYGPRSNVLAQEIMSPDFSENQDIQELIHQVFKLKHQFLQRLLEDGVLRGEIRKIDPIIGATALLGAISFYTMFQVPAMGHPGIPSDLKEESPARDHEFFQILFSGIGAVSHDRKTE